MRKKKGEKKQTDYMEDEDVSSKQFRSIAIAVLVCLLCIIVSVGRRNRQTVRRWSEK